MSELTVAIKLVVNSLYYSAYLVYHVICLTTVLAELINVIPIAVDSLTQLNSVLSVSPDTRLLTDWLTYSSFSPLSIVYFSSRQSSAFLALAVHSFFHLFLAAHSGGWDAQVSVHSLPCCVPYPYLLYSVSVSGRQANFSLRSWQWSWVNGVVSDRIR